MFHIALILHGGVRYEEYAQIQRFNKKSIKQSE